MNNLSDVLNAREIRWNLRTSLAEKEYCVISLTLRMPCEIRTSEEAVPFFDSFCLKVSEALKVFGKSMFRSVRESADGPYALWKVKGDVRQVKRLMTDIETFVPGGELIDLDVMDENKRQISRTELSIAQRKCLLCDNDAAFCTRNHTHPNTEVIGRIREIMKDELKNKEENSNG